MTVAERILDRAVSRDVADMIDDGIIGEGLSEGCTNEDIRILLRHGASIAINDISENIPETREFLSKQIAINEDWPETQRGQMTHIIQIEKRDFQMLCSECKHQWETPGKVVHRKVGKFYKANYNNCPKCGSKHSELIMND